MDVQAIVKELGLEGKEDQLLLMAVGEVVRQRILSGQAIMTEAIGETVAKDIQVKGEKSHSGEKMAYPYTRSKKWREVDVEINSFKTKINIYEDVYLTEEGKRKGYKQRYGGKVVVIGKTREGKLRSKTLVEKDKELIVWAWGVTKQNRKRHKLSQEEAEILAKKYSLSVKWDAQKKKSYFVIKDTTKDM